MEHRIGSTLSDVSLEVRDRCKYDVRVGTPIIEALLIGSLLVLPDVDGQC